MPKLPKFKDHHISPLTGPMNSLSPLDLVVDEEFRYVKNFRVDGAGRLKRAGGFRALFNDGNYNTPGTIAVSDSTPTPSGAWEANKTHAAFAQTSTSGSGEGATFSVVTDSSGNPAFTLVAGGSGYNASDTVLFTDPGSTSNTATLTVSSIKNNSDLHDQLGSKQDPTNSVREHITMLYEFESGSGSRKLIAATKSRIYALNQRSRNWIIIGDNGGSGYGEGTSSTYSTTKFKAAQLGNNIIFTNNYDEPLNWFFDTNPKRSDKNLVETIPDLVKLKITKVAHISEYKGFMFLADLEEDGGQQVSKVQWSDYIDATSYYPSVASLSGQQTVGDFGERIVGVSVLGDHLMIYKERSIWRCSLVSSSNLFVFKQVYQGENTPFYEDTLINVGDSHFYMSESGIYRMSISSLSPQRVDWIHNASGIVFKNEVISGEDLSSPRYVTGGMKDLKIVQDGSVSSLAACESRPPVIQTHPGNLTINANPCSASYTSSATLSVATSSGQEPFTYQWQQKLSSSNTWVNITGAQSSSYSIVRPQASDLVNKEFRVVVSNEFDSVNSNTASITLDEYNTTPTFSKHPIMDSKRIGQSKTFEARFCTPVTGIQWRRDVDSTPVNVVHDGSKYIVENGIVEPASGTAGYYYSKLTITNLTNGGDGVVNDETMYDCKLTNGSQTANSDNAQIVLIQDSVVSVDTDSGERTIVASTDTFAFLEHPRSKYELYEGEWIGRQIKSNNSGYLCAIERVVNGETVKYKGIYTAIKAVVSGGKKPYTMKWQIAVDTRNIKINHPSGSGGTYTATTGNSPSDWKTIKVKQGSESRLTSAYFAGQEITFANGGKITLKKDAYISDNTFPDELTGTITGTLAHDEQSTNTLDWRDLEDGKASGGVNSKYLKHEVRFFEESSGSPDKSNPDRDAISLRASFPLFNYVDHVIRCSATDGADSPSTITSNECIIDCRVIVKTEGEDTKTIKDPSVYEGDLE
tara:strand:+ start:2120 stop:5047 length:2928 start_codon:yes stop_codon:yes gene_type:complete